MVCSTRPLSADGSGNRSFFFAVWALSSTLDHLGRDGGDAVGGGNCLPAPFHEFSDLVDHWPAVARVGVALCISSHPSAVSFSLGREV